MDDATRARVRSRAGDRCEYCRARQDAEPFFRYQIEHVIPRQHGGSDDDSNRALACPHCNRHKGPNLAGLDPVTDALTPLFHPRRQAWDEHFAHRGPLVMGQTPVGRTTVRVLNMNDRVRVEHRALASGSGASWDSRMPPALRSEDSALRPRGDGRPCNSYTPGGRGARL